ncbi:DNA topoisomerase-3 [Chitinophaga eiseniae]|uniref:DNA topoisomerase n=1 Tax=Chitinophaga eiseniae TaxID=634771 RepID=A0A1T4SXK0_9BACT|nr:type IA DNA topoisomerase [Chitinophaga eiseniae]SKA32933.1 DNA topoisomerase-3 [Chitinophaga eiseniae]
MKAILAEKPSVAREIAALLGADHKEDGFLSGNNYLVTWAIGHLVTLAMPEDYNITGFKKESLPILPAPYLLTVRKIKKDKSFAADPAAVKQLKVIREVFGRCDSIIVATDAGREGELIFRYIYEHLGCRKPFERLWISSLTETAIRQGMANLKPGHLFDGLYLAGRCRSRADWLVGINGSQALSIAAGNGVYSLGRVQTPTLALICRRYLDHRQFSIKKYWQLALEHRKEFIDFKSLSEKRWEDRKAAEDALQSIQRAGKVSVTSVDVKPVTEHAPLLYDLTALQKEANKKLNFSAEQTLSIAQSLYEQKFITYPRTGSRYIPEDMWAAIPDLVRALDATAAYKPAVAKLRWGRFNKRIVNDLKVTDHHGLLITGKIPSALAAKEKAVYELIAYRLLEALSEPCHKEITHVALQTLHHGFQLKGCKILEPGWRAIKGSFSEEDSEPVQDLPKLKLGDELKIIAGSVLERETKPPALYTEATLLSAMESAGKDNEDPQMRKALQGLGIGTPATRAAIIETLFERDYVIREKKSLIPTSKGLQVYELVKDKRVADVAMTAHWETALQKIEHGEGSHEDFEKEMESYASQVTQELLSCTVATPAPADLVCPRCKARQLIIREKLIKCPEEACNWVVFRTVCGVQLRVAEIESLVRTGRTPLIKGMKSKLGKKFDAFIVMDDKYCTSFEFPDSKRRK